MIDTVTITGADDEVDHADLARLSSKYPFVEWGVLLLAWKFGYPRYPTPAWMAGLHGVRRSIHLCGEHVVAAMNHREGQDALFRLEAFHRVQVNLRRVRSTLDHATAENALVLLSVKTQPYILQVDSFDDSLLLGARARGATVVPLLDSSEGRGVERTEWPRALGPSCGYAGGLSPDNLARELPRIDEASGSVPCWIDMETGVRDDRNRFDLARVERALEICAPFVRCA